MMPRVAALVLNFNDAKDTLECVESLERSDYPELEIVLVDNASEDQSWLKIAEKYPGITVLRNKENLGYAGGNNAGARFAIGEGCDYIFVLNNDVVVEKSAVRLLVEYCLKNPSATIAAPKVYRFGTSRTIDSVGTSMDWFRLRPRLGDCGVEDKGRFPAVLEREIIPGSALLLSRKLFEVVGFFDEKFFLIHEDADLCLRNRKAGFKNAVVTSTVVHHKVSSTLSRYPFLAAYYSTRNFLYLAKHRANPGERLWVSAGLLCLILKNFLRSFFANDGERKKINGFFKGMRDYYADRMGRQIEINGGELK